MMNHKKSLAHLITVLSMAFTLACLGAEAASGMTLAEGGRAIATIVIADQTIPAEETAARELATYLQKITRAAFTTTKEAAFVGGGPAIYLGPTSFARKAGVEFSALGNEEWIIRSMAGNLVIAGGRPRGTLFGVYEFLEKYGGCSWLDEDTEIIPARPAFELPELREQRQPAFRSRGYYTGFSRGATSFHVRNKHMLHSYDATYGYQEGLGSPNGCHTFYYYCKDWPDKPEYWSFRDGKRLGRPTSASDKQFCLSNPEVRQLTLARLREYIRSDREKAAQRGAPPPRIYDLSHNDCEGYCLCRGCKAILDREGAYSGVLLDFINEIARGIRDEYPDILIQTFAYTFTLEPPRHIKPEDNVLIQVCDLGSEWYPITRSENLRSVLHPDNQYFQETVKTWSALAKHIAVWDYWKIYKITFPYTNVSSLQPDLQFFRDNRGEKLFVEGEDLDSGSFVALKQWLGLKLMDDPDRPAADLIRLFVRGYYGPAADTMQEYLRYLEQRIADTPGSFGRPHPLNWKYFDRDFFVKVNELLDRAERQAAGSPACLAHVQRERVPVDYAALFMWDKLAGQGMQWPLDKQHVLARYEANKGAVLRLYYGGEKLTAQLGNLANEVRMLNAMPLPLPEELRGRQVVGFLWPDLPREGRVDDPEATGGVAIRLGPRPNQADFHARPLAMGIYDAANKKFGPSLTFKPEDVPQDGKYHLYRIGSFPVGEKTYVWFHWTWLLQAQLARVYQPPLEKTMAVYASVKVTGPSYVKGSTAEDGVWVDRVMLVEAE
ncbi:MAG: DUF4838 domain-containing protein [Armatimonadota bacterium]